MSPQSEQLNQMIETLKAVSIFQSFAEHPDELEKIARILKKENKKSGEAAIKEGESGDTLYIMKSGTVDILKKTLEDEQYTVVRLESKDGVVIFFGELGLLDSDKRSATVTCVTDCEFLVLSRADFIELGDKHPNLCLPITREISKILASRLRKANQDIITLFEALVKEVSSTGE